MLGMHVYEAVDMPYDQQLKDIVGPLQRLVDRHSYCTGVVFLVDMGSLEEAYKALENVTDSTIGVVNNVSTGLAARDRVGVRRQVHRRGSWRCDRRVRDALQGDRARQP